MVEMLDGAEKVSKIVDEKADHGIETKLAEEIIGHGHGNDNQVKPDMAGLGEFLKPLNEKLMKAISMTEGRRSDFFNHIKTVAESLTALAWIAYVGKDWGMSMPIAHLEESWQAAEFYNNKVP